MCETYDLFVIRPLKASDHLPSVAFDSRLLLTNGTIELGVSLEEVMNLKKRVEGEGQGSIEILILPSRYRTALVSRSDAWEIANLRHRDLVETGEPLDPPQGGFDEGAFWTFNCGHQVWQAQGYIPGAVFIYVDKLDGHIWSDQDVQDFYNLQLIKQAPPWPPDPVTWGDPNVFIPNWPVVPDPQPGAVAVVSPSGETGDIGRSGIVLLKKDGQLCVKPIDQTNVESQRSDLSSREWQRAVFRMALE